MRIFIQQYCLVFQKIEIKKKKRLNVYDVLLLTNLNHYLFQPLRMNKIERVAEKKKRFKLIGLNVVANHDIKTI